MQDRGGKIMVTNEILKEIIIKKYEEEGLSFADIAHLLEKEYNIKKSRQAINGLYKRSKKQQEKSDEIDPEKKIDIFNLYIMGYTYNRIQNELGFTIYKIKQLINNNKDNIKDIRQYKIQIIVDSLLDNKDIDTIKSHLSYKTYNILPAGLQQLVAEAVTLIIEKQLNNTIIRLRDKGVDCNTIKQSINEFKRNYKIPYILTKDD